MTARATAPRIAIKISTEVTSKGSSSWVNRTALSSSVEVMPWLSDAVPIPCACRMTVEIRARMTTAAGKPTTRAALLPSVRSSRPALSSITTKVNSTMMAPA